MLKRWFGLLSRRERIRAGLLLLGMLVQAGLELVGVASILPFMSVVADPESLHRSSVLSRLYEVGGFSSDLGFMTALGLATIGILALTNTVSALVTWAILRFVWGTHHSVSMRLLRGYLGRPYAYFVARNTAALNRNVLSDVSTAVVGVLLPLLTLLARGMVALSIVALLALIDPVLAITVVGLLGGAYGVIYLAVRRRQAYIGRLRAVANTDRFRITAEAFGGIKTLKVLNRETSFAERFASASRAFSRTSASNSAIAMIPRYVLETIAFGGILLIVLYFLRRGEGLTRIVPMLSLYAFAGYRLMPTLQQIFSSVAKIRFNSVVIEDLVADLRETADSRPLPPPTARLPFREEIRCNGLRFSHPDADAEALRGIDLVIPRNHMVGLVGASGSGKTTLVDLLLGLYEPEQGDILIDGQRLTADTAPRWRAQIGYVPQHLFLADDTIAANIAFGIPTGDIDPERVREAGRIAHLAEFVEELRDGYDTVVGERGVRLSGGQRQRIGIARALYHDPEVLLLDEATSALDGKTERDVMDGIRELSGTKTIVVIAHRLRTVEAAEAIHLLSDGRIIESGTYAELTSTSEAFRILGGARTGGKRP